MTQPDIKAEPMSVLPSIQPESEPPLFVAGSPASPHLSELVSKPKYEALESSNGTTVSTATVLQQCEGKTRKQRVMIQEQAISDGEKFLHAVWTVLKEHQDSIPACKNRINAISQIKTKEGENGITIGLIGMTGSGKSTVINALLPYDSLLPSSSEMACTAVVAEIGYNHLNDPGRLFRAVIYGISRADFKKELDEYYEDRKSIQSEADGEDDEMDPETQERLDCTFAKLKCLYPHLKSPEDMDKTSVAELLDHPNAAKLLGRQYPLFESNLKDFREKIKRYVGITQFESPDGEHYYLWPLVKNVKIYVKADILKSGITLVDLPGNHDTNAARSAVAANYMKNLSIACVLVRVARATNDKSGKDGLSQELQRTMQLDGIYSSESLFFIISQCDSSLENTGEMLNYIKDHPNLQKIKADAQERFHTSHENILDTNKAQTALEAEQRKAIMLRENLEREIRKAEKELSKFSNSLGAGQKRKRDSDDIAELSDEERSNLVVDLKNKRERLIKGEAVIEAQQKRWVHNEELIKKFKAEHRKTACELKSACIKNRNEIQTAALQENFQKTRCQMGDENASRSLQVFSTSAMAFWSIMRGDEGDALRRGFLSIEDTGIPALRDALIATSFRGREMYARAFIEATESAASVLKIWADDCFSDYKMRADERVQVESAVESKLQLLEQSLSKLPIETATSINSLVKSNLYDKFPGLEKKAAKSAQRMVIKWSEVPWSTHRATNRRYGNWERVAITGRVVYHWSEDLENIFCGKHGLIREGWDVTFGPEMIKHEKAYREAAKSIIENFASSLLDPALGTSPAMAYALQLIADNVLRSQRHIKANVTSTFEAINDARKSAWRLAGHEIKSSWNTVYEKCGAEKGRGLFAKNKVRHNRHVGGNGGPLMYQRISKLIQAHLNKLLNKLPDLLKKGLHDARNQIQEDLTAMIERHSADGIRSSDRRAKDHRKITLKQALQPHFEALESAWSKGIEIEDEKKSDDSEQNDSGEDDGDDDVVPLF